MTPFACRTCADSGTIPKKGTGVVVVHDPCYQRHGSPTMNKTKGWGVLSAPDIAKAACERGLPYVVNEYKHSREVVLVACWWSGVFGRGKTHQTLKTWAEMAGDHLWYGCVQISDPPVLTSKQ